MKVKFLLSIGYSGATHEDTLDFADGTTDEEIAEEYEVWCQNYMDGGWWIVEGEDV